MTTLKDLAKKLGVSVSTVSKALNDSPEISKKTRDRIKAVAQFYKYQPNRLALNLKTSRTSTIGVIVPSIANRFFAMVLQGLERQANADGYDVIICISNESIEKEKKQLQLLANGSVDGFIIAASEETIVQQDFSHIQQVSASNLPIIVFDRVMKHMPFNKVLIEDTKSVELVVEQLVKSNKSQIAFVSTIANLNVGRLRLDGYKLGLKNASLSFNEQWLLEINDDQDIQQRLTDFLQTYPEIDGIVAADNTTGTIAINVAKNLGLKVPQDIAVIGFADEHISNMSIPKLAYVDQQAELMGSKAFKLCLDRIKNGTDNNEVTTDIVEVTIKNAESL